MLMKTQIYVVTIWMLGDDSKFLLILKVTSSCLSAAEMMKPVLEGVE